MHAPPDTPRREALAALGALAGAVLLAPAPAFAGALHREGRFVFGSPAELLVAGPVSGPAVAGVFAGLQAMNDRWNAWKPGEVSRINAALRSGRSARPSPALRAMLHAATRLERSSGGFFNAGIGGLVGAWGFHADRLEAGERPRESVLARWRGARPSLSQLEWRGAELASRNPALQLDFGAIGKGVALDWALDRLDAAGAAGALLNLGGNLAATGGRDGAAGTGWTVGIRDPLGTGLAATIATRGREAVVTSGVYERLRVLDGEAFHHILDPSEGRPAPGLASVTVLHGSATVADAAATALLAAGPARWPAVAARMGVDAVLVIDHQRRVGVSPALRGRVVLVPGFERA